MWLLLFTHRTAWLTFVIVLLLSGARGCHTQKPKPIAEKPKPTNSPCPNPPCVPPVGAQIHGAVYVDANFNRIKDIGEVCAGKPGCAGVAIHVRGVDSVGNAVNLAGLTNNSGNFSFPVLSPGTYTVCEDVPNTWFSFVPCTGPYDLVGGAILDLERIGSPFGNFQDDPIPAPRALDVGCLPKGITDDRTFARVDPEWARIADPVILEGRIISPTEKFGTVFPDARYVDSNNNNTWDPGEPVIQDRNFNNIYDIAEAAYSVGDGRPLLAGTPVKTDPRVKAAKGTFLVYDINNNGIYDAGEPLIGGFAPFPSPGDNLNLENSDSQAPSEVAEEDTIWNHQTHDKTQEVIPDEGYRHLLSKFVDSTTQAVLPHNHMEVEWDEASDMTLNGNSNDANDMTWGSFPQFAWPSVGDRVWVEGQWIFDCGHPGSRDPKHAQFETEIHPPRAIVTFRLNHSVGNIPFVNAPYPFGVPEMPVTGLSSIPIAEADIFVSGNSGGATDVCSLRFRNLSITLDADECFHSGFTTPVNDRNYVFDIYPPGTDFSSQNKELNGTFKINSPSRDGSGDDISLQWLVIDRPNEIPVHAGTFTGSQGWTTSTVEPLICPIDKNTPPPNQSETTCPSAPVHPTRLRVLLPFKGTNANVFAKTILLAWDDVPDNTCPSPGLIPPAITTDLGRTMCAPIRNFDISLHKFKINDNAEGSFTDGDWRVFVDVAGQWRYVSGLPFEHNGDCNDGDSLAQDVGKRSIVGSAEGNGSGDCFRFDRHPWRVRIQDGMPIHIAVGGFESDNEDGEFCRDEVGLGCDPSIPAFGCIPLIGIGGCRDDRIGTYEFDLVPPNYAAPPQINVTHLTVNDPGDVASYSMLFTVTESLRLQTLTSELTISQPQGRGVGGEVYVTSRTPLTFIPRVFLGSQDSVAVQYRLRRAGASLPTFPSTFLFPLHWTNTGFSQSQPPPIFLNQPEGVYVLQFSAQKATTANGRLVITETEPRHTTRLVLDNTPPVVSAPANITIPATEGAGARWQTGSPLTPFLFGSSAVDNLDPAPVRLFPQVAGQDVRPFQTLFPLGTTAVTFLARDAAGNIGTASANVTVVLGQPQLNAVIDAQGSSQGLFFVDLRLLDNGTGNARSVSLAQVIPQILDGYGTVLFDSYHSPALPFLAGNINVGSSTHRIRLFFRVPKTVTGFSLTLNGTMKDVAGNQLAFSTLNDISP
jgi:hypothetical protein